MSFDSNNTESTGFNGSEYRYRYPEIFQDSPVSGSTSSAPEPPKSDTGTKHAPSFKKSTALLLAGCLTVSLVGGAGGAYIASKVGFLGSSGSSVIYQAVESGSGDTELVGYAGVVPSIESSVVAITTNNVVTNYFWGNYVTQGAGSGIILTADGYIATNYHVVKSATGVTVTLPNGTEYDALLIGKDEEMDIAVLKIDAADLTPVILGDSDSLHVGDAVLAVGNPLGNLSGTVTDGIISALSREITIDGTTMTLLQTSAAVNPGNSGGGLFDINGNLIGIVNAKSSTDSSGNAVDNIGFAIPINNVKDFLSDLITHGYVTGQIRLGISLVEINDERTARYYGLDRTGLYVQSVESDSDASRAGLLPGDCILSFDNEKYTTQEKFVAALKKHSVGDNIPVKVYRNGKEQSLQIHLTEYIPSGATVK